MKRYSIDGNRPFEDSAFGQWCEYEDAKGLERFCLEQVAEITALRALLKDMQVERAQLQILAATRNEALSALGQENDNLVRLGSTLKQDIHRLNNELTSVILERDAARRQSGVNYEAVKTLVGQASVSAQEAPQAPIEPPRCLCGRGKYYHPWRFCDEYRPSGDTREPT